MEIKLNATELEAAVTSHLANEGIDLKNKIIDFEFEGTCSINIEVDESVEVEPAKAKPKAKATRAKRKPKVELVEPEAAEEDTTVDAVVEELETQTQPSEDEAVEEVVEEAEPEVKATPTKVKPDNSIFG